MGFSGDGFNTFVGTTSAPVERKWYKDYDFAALEKRHGVVVVISRGEITDQYLNVLALLPKKKPADVEAWFKEALGTTL